MLATGILSNLADAYSSTSYALAIQAEAEGSKTSSECWPYENAPKRPGKLVLICSPYSCPEVVKMRHLDKQRYALKDEINTASVTVAIRTSFRRSANSHPATALLRYYLLPPHCNGTAANNRKLLPNR